MKWYIIKTKPKNESRVFQNYTRAGIECFNPEYIDTTFNGHQIRTSLFKTYLFVNTQLEKTFNMLKYTRGVSHIVSFGNKQAEVSPSIIDSIKGRLNKDGFIQMKYNDRFKNGDKVRVKSGVFRDFEAIFDKTLSEIERVQILLGTIESPKRVKIRPCYLEKI